MANVTAKKVIIDGHSNAVIQLTGNLDTANAVLAPAVVIGDFTQNDPRMTALLGFEVEKIQYSIGYQLQILLAWNATAPQDLALVAGHGELDYCECLGPTPLTGAAGFNGALNLTTFGWASGNQLYTILLQLKKLYTK